MWWMPGEECQRILDDLSWIFFKENIKCFTEFFLRMKRTLSHIFIPLWMNLGSSCRLKRIYITSGDVYVFLCSVVLSDKIGLECVYAETLNSRMNENWSMTTQIRYFLEIIGAVSLFHIHKSDA